jgi:hypothetical protein
MNILKRCLYWWVELSNIFNMGKYVNTDFAILIHDDLL